MSSPDSYQLTSVLANLRNRRFYEIADPGVECFAPFTASEKSMNRFIYSLVFLAESHIKLRKCLPTCGTALFLKFSTPE